MIGGPAITWVGEDGSAIARLRNGKAVVQTVRFADVGRAAWEQAEAVLRGAPTESAAQLVRAITDAWTSRR